MQQHHERQEAAGVIERRVASLDLRRARTAPAPTESEIVVMGASSGRLFVPNVDARNLIQQGPIAELSTDIIGYATSSIVTLSG